MLSTLSTVFILVFSAPAENVLVGSFHTQEDCEEVAWTLNRYTSGNSVYLCVKDQDA